MAIAERPARDGAFARTSQRGDAVFSGLTFFFAIVVLVASVGLVVSLVVQAWPALTSIGLKVLSSADWDSNHNIFGALSLIYGTIVSSVLALILAGIIGVMIAVFLSELAPPILSRPTSFLVEMLAAVPSIIFGLWGIYVLFPFLTPFETWLGSTLGFIPFIGSNVSTGGNLLVASLVLAIMILPTVAALSRDVMAAVPGSQREGMLALGATRWEVVWRVVIPYARAGIIGAIILALGRAIGETMAVKMVVGNDLTFHGSLLAPGTSIAAVLANDAGEAASNPLWIGALFELGLLLFLISVTLNVVARLLVWSVNRSGGALTAR